MFEQLVLVDHPNIVKLHKYWLDVKDSKARVGRSQGGKASRGSLGWGRDASGSWVGIPALLLFLPWDTAASSLLSPCAGPAWAGCCGLVQPMGCAQHRLRGEAGKLTLLFPARSSSSQNTCPQGA